VDELHKLRFRNIANHSIIKGRRRGGVIRTCHQRSVADYIAKSGEPHDLLLAIISHLVNLHLTGVNAVKAIWFCAFVEDELPFLVGTARFGCGQIFQFTAVAAAK
jgi:hypothetical protein